MQPLAQPTYGLPITRRIRPTGEKPQSIIQRSSGKRIIVVIDPAGGEDVNTSGFSDEAAIQENVTHINGEVMPPEDAAKAA